MVTLVGQVVRAGAPDCAAQPLQCGRNPAAQLPQDRCVSHAVPASELACADPVGVKPPDGPELLIAEGRAALANLHASVAKRCPDGLNMHFEFRCDLLLG